MSASPLTRPLAPRLRAGAFGSCTQELLSYWCGEQGHSGSAKCKQMEFGKRMTETDSGEERKRMAMEFHGASTAAEKSALEQETRDMMQAVCSSPRAEAALFVSTCAKLQAPGARA